MISNTKVVFHAKKKREERKKKKKQKETKETGKIRGIKYSNERG